jgi:hypothetical protein
VRGISQTPQLQLALLITFSLMPLPLFQRCDLLLESRYSLPRVIVWL